MGQFGEVGERLVVDSGDWEIWGRLVEFWTVFWGFVVDFGVVVGEAAVD